MDKSELTSKKMRDSNMELLRIVAMSMVLAGHFFTHGLKGIIAFTTPHFISMPLTICGVNIFFLISGWFGVRFTVKSVTRIIVTTFFFMVLCYAFLGYNDIWSGVYKYQLLTTPVESSGLWFIMVYLGILVLSPLVNAGIKGLSHRQFNIFIAAMSIFCMYCGWYGGNYANVNGYTLVQGVWLYCVGHWLRENRLLTDRIGGIWLAVIYVVSAMILACLLVFKIDWKVYWAAYNSPFVVTMSLAIFLLFTRIRFRSRAVNYIAGASLGCYMLQDGILGRNWLYGQIESIYRYFTGNFESVEATLYIVLALAAIFVAIWAASIILTPVANLLSMLVTNFLQKIWKAKA